MKPLRVGIVGLGMVAQIMHLPYLKEMDEFEIVALCDVSKKLTQKMAGQYGVENTFSDAAEMIKESELDAIFILTFYHSEIAAAAAEAGVHVFCEKPVAFSVNECEEMIKDVKAAGTVFMAGYMKRYDDGFILGQKHFRKMLKNREVRQITVHDACFSNDLALKTMYDIRSYNDIPKKIITETNRKMNARIRDALGGAPKNKIYAYRVLLETGSHDINVLRGAFGNPKKVLFTEVWPEGNWVNTVLDYGEDMRCFLSVARTARNWGDEYITAYGMKNTVSVEFPIPFKKSADTLVRCTGMNGNATKVSVTCASQAEAFKNELRHFNKCIRRNETPLTSIYDALEDTKLMTDIINAAS